jgi:hypothetical protein
MHNLQHSHRSRKQKLAKKAPYTYTQGCQIFKPKIPTWENYGGPWNGEGILWPFEYITYGHFGTFYGHLLIQWQVGIFSPILVYCVKKNLAALPTKTFAGVLAAVKALLKRPTAYTCTLLHR